MTTRNVWMPVMSPHQCVQAYINDNCRTPHQWWLYETTSMIPVMTVIMSWHQWSISLRQAAAARLSVHTARPVPPAHTTEHTAGSSWPTGWGCTPPRLRSSPAAAGWCLWPWHPLLVWCLPVLSSLSLWPPADHTQATAAVGREIWQISLLFLNWIHIKIKLKHIWT